MLYAKKNSIGSNEQGYMLVIFVVLMGIGALVSLAALQLSSSHARTVSANETRNDRYYLSETGMAEALSWARINSKSLITPFTKSQFYSVFARTEPSVGSNDTSPFDVPTRIKLKNTTNSALLTNDSSMGTAAFPTTTHIVSNASFAPTTSFSSSATSGSSLVRLTLVDAIALDPSKDYGTTAAAQTDFYPIYRVDAMTSMDRGAHVLGYIVGSLTYYDTIGFYGRDFVEARQPCDSYNSADGAYGGGNKRAKCPIGSNGNVQIHQNTDIYGSVRTNGSIVTTSPYGGDVCSDFASGCPNAGTKCEGTSCNVPGLPSFNSWSSYCPTDQGNRTISSNTTWVLGGGSPSQNCWATVTINSNKTLTLTSTNYPYYIKTLTLQNNSNSRINIQPNPSSGVVTVYVETITGNSINGNQLLNSNNRPSQLRFNYLGSAALTFNGTAAINAAVVSPNAGVTVSGNFTFQGGILAKDLTLTGSGAIHYDESLGGSSLVDMTFRLRNEMQYYY